jgi:hypothetical protein
MVVLNRELVGDLTAAEAAALERQVRQVRRMVAAYRKEGAAYAWPPAWHPRVTA